MIRPTLKAFGRIKYLIKSVMRTKMPMIAMVKKLNPIIRGWTNYYKVSPHSLPVFSYLSYYVYNLWWKWAIKVHPYRNKKWLVRKYIHRNNTKRWRIGVDKNIVLFDPITVLFNKVANIKVGINPYTNIEYYEDRFRNLEVEKFRKSIYTKYKYKCVACNELLDDREVIELHRKDPKKGYTWDNTVPLHKSCHESVTFAKKEWFRNLDIKK
jgi:RNA-directed DNA polymerase